MNSSRARWANWTQCACFVFLLFVGCFPGGGKRADLIIVNGRDPESVDPAIVTGQADGRLAQALFEGLTRYNSKAEPEPGLAERWEISPDRRTYKFFLRPNAKWSTGEPITAHDFVYSWLRILNPATGADYSGNLYPIKNAEAYNTNGISDPNAVGIHALDDRTLQVDLHSPTPYFLDLCAYAIQAAVPRGAIEKYGDRWLLENPVPCSGPYQLEYWRLNDRIRVRKNTNYWGADKVQLDVVDYLAVSLPTTALNLYETKEADVIWDKDVVPTEILDVLRTRPDFHSHPILATYFYRCNTSRPPFNDARLRKAFGMAVDRKRITERITKGGEATTSAIVPAGLPGYVSPEGLTFDPEGARKLLAEAGFPNGQNFPRIEYTFRSGRDDEKIAVELKEMWKRELNVDVGLRAVEHKVWLRLQSMLDYDLIRSSWVGDYPDPNTFLDLFMSANPNNRTGWKNSAYDDLMRRGNSLTDPAGRFRLLNQAEKILVHDEAPIVPLYIYNGFSFWDSNRLTGIEFNIRDEHPVHAIRRLQH